jgi:hypothetical protein
LDRTSGRGDTETGFTAQLSARVSLAILRSAAIQERELEAAGATSAPPIDHMLETARQAIARHIPAAERVAFGGRLIANWVLGASANPRRSGLRATITWPF